ncbi:MAG TPA: LLM class flavin-dependent oxidoreductase [Actinomycetota bacterium]|nr:LLM class flavin-dependent oxidoreductase [Actinomycetota bacterium]
MKIGIGLPNTIPGTPGRMLVEWARHAEDLGFSSLATIGRVAYPSYDTMATLAAAGAVTERIGLVSNVLLIPTHDPVMIAKAAASVDQISGGRFTMGIGVGTRDDDYQAAGVPFEERGKRADRSLEVIHRAWAGELVEGARKPVTPAPIAGTVPIIVGGSSDAAIRRTVRWGIGWTAGGSAPQQVGPFAERVRAAWKEAGREGEPKIMALAYYALGGAEQEGLASLTDYYGDFGPKIFEYMPKSPEDIRTTAKMFEDAGVDELVFDPTVADLKQVDLLAEAAL